MNELFEVIASFVEKKSCISHIDHDKKCVFIYLNY